MNLCKRPEFFLLKVWWWAWVKIRVKIFQLKEVAFDLQLIHHCNLFQVWKRPEKEYSAAERCMLSFFLYFCIYSVQTCFIFSYCIKVLLFPFFTHFPPFFYIFVPIFLFLFLAWVWVKSLPICISNLIGWWHRNTQRFTLLHSLSTWLAVWDFERRVAFLCVTFQPFFLYVSSHFHRKYETEGKLSRGNSGVTCLIFNLSSVISFWTKQASLVEPSPSPSPYLPFCSVQHWFGLPFRSFTTAKRWLFIFMFFF